MTVTSQIPLFHNEKELQKAFVKMLKNCGWITKEEIWDNTHTNRLDVVASHPVFDSNFCFELKIPKGFNCYTKALRQMIRYRESKFRYDTNLLCLITPQFNHNNFNYEAWIERFFWRWGFGVGDFSTMKVHFVNAQSKDIVDLLHPKQPWFTPEYQINRLKQRASNYWNFEEETQ